MNLEDAELRMRSFAEGDEYGAFTDNNAAATAVMAQYDRLSRLNTAQGLHMAQLGEEASQMRTFLAVLETFRDRVYALTPPEVHLSDHDVVAWLRERIGS